MKALVPSTLRILSTVKISCTLLLLLLFGSLHAQDTDKLDQLKEEVVEEVCTNIRAHYLSYEKAVFLSNTLRKKYESEAYSPKLNLDEFTYAVTQDLRTWSGDKHFNFMPRVYDASRAIRLRADTAYHSFQIPSKVLRRNKQRFHRDHFPYEAIEIIDEQLAYLSFSAFDDESENLSSKRLPLRRVLGFLHKANALVLDLRYNSGGDFQLMRYMASFFIKEPRTYLLTTEEFRHRYADTTANAAGGQGVKRVGANDTLIRRDYHSLHLWAQKDWHKRPIYILTSSYTFSAAEALIYLLRRHHKQVTVIGERTGGASHGLLGGVRSDLLSAYVPRICIYDKENYDYSWEETGLEPDIHCPADSALYYALQECLPQRHWTLKERPREVFPPFKKHFPPKDYWLARPEDYVGDYQRYKVTTRNHQLYLQFDLNAPRPLEPIKEDWFRPSESFLHHVVFERNEKGEVCRLLIERYSGYVASFRKIETEKEDTVP